KSLCASCCWRSNCFFLSSRALARVTRSVSLSLSPWVCSSLVILSMSSLRVLSCWRLGSHFFCRSTKARWTSLVWLTAAWKETTAILAGPTWALGAAPAGAGAAGMGGAGVCDRPASEDPTTSSTGSTSKRFIRPENSFRDPFDCSLAHWKNREQSRQSSTRLRTSRHSVGSTAEEDADVAGTRRIIGGQNRSVKPHRSIKGACERLPLWCCEDGGLTAGRALGRSGVRRGRRR